jgi:beta-glucanase (GH16 family)
MNKYNIFVALFWVAIISEMAHAASPIYADGDLAPLGAPDGLVNSADYLIANRIVLESLTPTQLELSHGDVYPVGAPDGVLNIQDMLLIQRLALEPGANNYVENIDLFVDGAATVTAGGSSTTIIVDGYIGPGATVVNNPNFTDPDDSSNTVWNVSISGDTGNVFMGTGNLSSDPVLDSGFDFSGAGFGQLVFDIKVISITPGTTLTVKIDSGYPNLGQVALTPSQYSVGSWRRVAINFADLLANPGPGGASLDLNNVVNAFVMEVTGGNAHFYLDNIFVSHACSEVGGCKATVNTKAAYSLVWSDEFDGTSLASDNWSLETGYGSNGWGNDEWQLYTTNPDNISVTGGNLMISARCASPPACNKRNGSITSARINSLNKFAFKYGKVEARIKPPVGNGAWPAFWMLGKNFPAVGWPQSGEVDIMEIHNLYSNEFTTHFTMHWDNPGWLYDSQYKTLPYSLGDDFHVFSAEWNVAGMVGKIDGIPFFNLPINPATMEEFLEEFYMILNVAIGGTLGGAPDASTPWPQTMLVDYVRVYQEDGGNGTYSIGAPPPAPEMGVYSESHTASVLPYSSIINGADFGGNVLNINQSSTNTVPFDGSVTLQVGFNNTGSNFGGFLFNFTIGRDISYYQTLKFSINKTAMNTMSKLDIELENPGQLKFAVQLANYTPTVSGNWATYEIPLSDFSGADLTNILYLGIWTPRNSSNQLTFGTLYFDDIHFAGGGG